MPVEEDTSKMVVEDAPTRSAEDASQTPVAEKPEIRASCDETETNEKSLVSEKYDYRDSDSDESSISVSSLSVSSLSESDWKDFETSLQSEPKKELPLVTKGELQLGDLPRIEELKITVPDQDIQRIGSVSGIVDQLVIVHSAKDIPALDFDTVLFLSGDKPLGQVFDIFGRVAEPYYVVRFNTAADIQEKAIEIGNDVYYAPTHNDITTYVFVGGLTKDRGSDASWKDNNEPPVECLDFSDDEQERSAKQQRRAKHRQRSSSSMNNGGEVWDNESVQTSNYFWNIKQEPTDFHSCDKRMRLDCALAGTSHPGPNPWTPAFPPPPLNFPIQIPFSARNSNSFHSRPWDAPQPLSSPAGNTLTWPQPQFPRPLSSTLPNFNLFAPPPPPPPLPDNSDYQPLPQNGTFPSTSNFQNFPRFP